MNDIHMICTDIVAIAVFIFTIKY